MVKEEHCDRNSLLSVDTDDVAAHGAQSAQDGPQRLNNQQKQKVVGKNLNLVLLTTLVCVDNLTSRERGRKVGTGTIPSSPRIYYLCIPQGVDPTPCIPGYRYREIPGFIFIRGYTVYNNIMHDAPAAGTGVRKK